MDINEIAMEVILNASIGRDKIDEAYGYIISREYEKVKELLEEADRYILKAHKAQTATIQKQAANEKVEYSLLFIHAQDTLMTINSEFRIIKNLIPLFKERDK